MLLSEIRNIVREAKKISLVELSIQLKEDVALIHAMLQQLIQKGIITVESNLPVCQKNAPLAIQHPTLFFIG